MSSEEQIQEILSVISPGSESGTDQEWDLIIAFVRQHPDANLAELIYNHAPANVEPWKVGSLFDSLIWAPYSDNGGLLMETMEHWLRGDDPRKIEYALAIDGVFPFKKEAEMLEVLTQIKLQWPRLAARCDELITHRKGS